MTVKRLPKFLAYLCLLLALAFLSPPAAQAGSESGIIYQTSTIGALMAGVYDGGVTFRELKRHGDLGLGTFNALDGEMVALDGKFYQVKSDGVAYPVPDNLKTPFADVIFFRADKVAALAAPKTFAELQKYLDGLLPSPNIFYAVKITGRFKQVKTRSVARQNRPYPPLAEAVQRQATFEFQGAQGTMVGFWCPAYAAGLNVPGYHLHFLTADKKAGGHVLDCETNNVKIEIAYAPRFYLALPGDTDFYRVDLSPVKTADINKVEK